MSAASLSPFRRVVPAALLGLAMLSGPAAGAEQAARPGRATIERYLFLPDSDTYLIGDRIVKWESDPLVVLYREADRPLVEALAGELHDSGALGEWRILIVPPIAQLREGGHDRPTFTLAVDTRYFETIMAMGPLRGLEAYHAQARKAGCYAQPSVPYARRDYVIVAGQIVAREDLDEARLRDCLLRGLLLNAGLMYTPALAFADAPMDPAARAEALAVLALVYRPEVTPGMTREAFFAALEAGGLIGE
jgi:hypothetical protein